ncbi:MAG: putative selenium-dependent hydroxylase accessory protein YqeC [Chloroflexi bacterium]|nr:putative selenium-dependent hydroxylase accessory protein YqeC [Chloroflexota bacterium]
MKLQRAFDIVPGDVVAFVGAGGKTSTLIALGHELAEAGLRVLATTTTRIGADQLDLMPYAARLDTSMAAVSLALNDHRFVFLYDDIRQNKVYGAGKDQIPHLLDSVDSDVLLIEADGSRGLPLKAPKEHEPVIPAETTLVVPVASLSVLGQPLDEEHVYNAQAIDDRYGFGIGNRVKSPWVAQVVRDPELGLKAVPDGARVVVLLNQVPAHGYLRGRARMVAQMILRSPRVYGVALGSVRGSEPVHEVQRHVGAVVLAAGLSRRMGQPKVLLPWTERKTIIEHILDQLLLAKVQHITVVTGHRADEVRPLAARIGAGVVHNPDYATGEMLSSLKAGLQAMPPHISAALVVLGDQPRIQPRVIVQVLTAYAEGAGDIIAPSYRMRRGHPILIDRRYWQDILNLPADGAPRDVIDRHKDRIGYVNVDTDSVLRDIDTPDDYRDERRSAGLGC